MIKVFYTKVIKYDNKKVDAGDMFRQKKDRFISLKNLRPINDPDITIKKKIA
ncbi:MAG: hypothetical protein KKA19_07800 [Candidatus Margulisbacteria bacterium]|nr:hypothetical protein [Candidatus Margulisiibacteriota bacterium]